MSKQSKEDSSKSEGVTEKATPGDDEKQNDETLDDQKDTEPSKGEDKKNEKEKKSSIGKSKSLSDLVVSPFATRGLSSMHMFLGNLDIIPGL